MIKSRTIRIVDRYGLMRDDDSSTYNICLDSQFPDYITIPALIAKTFDVSFNNKDESVLNVVEGKFQFYDIAYKDINCEDEILIYKEVL